jgi:hypothetical protein
MTQVQYKGLTKGLKVKREILVGVVMLTIYTPVHGTKEHVMVAGLASRSMYMYLSADF